MATALMLLVCLSGGCATMPVREGFTAQEQATAVIADMPQVRMWADAPPRALHAGQRALRSTVAYRSEAERGHPRDRIKVLSISGGAENGAYGAGVLVGWTKAGARPDFTVVSGVSTGALIAPFAFLGSEYDSHLRAMYMQISVKDVFRRRSPLRGLFGTSMADTSPLRRLIASFVTEDLLQEIAAEHRKGRRLLVVTTNLDAQRPVVWDMGAIAVKGDVAALDLFRNVLLASASIPGLFPPVMIEAEADGHRFKEMHVDGGTTVQVLTLPDAILSGGAPGNRILDRLELYVLFNNPLAPDFKIVEPRTFTIASRSVLTLIRVNGRNNLISVYRFARQHNIPLLLSYIGPDFDVPYEHPFDPAYMRPLFDYGYRSASAGAAWMRVGTDILDRLAAQPSQ